MSDDVDMSLTHQNLRGIRVPGWEDINFAELSKRTGNNAKHLRQALTGRQACTTTLLRRVADALDMTVGEVIVKIDLAKAKYRPRLLRK